MKQGFYNVLLLNSTYEPIKILNWKRAITLYFKGKVEILSDYQATIRSENLIMNLPSVIKLHNYVRIRYLNKVKFTKENIFIRDGFRCAYCNNVFPKNMLTLDHVIPSSKGGHRNWENIVTACMPCNINKGNRTPEQAKMTLHIKPKKPQILPYITDIINYKHIPEDWQQYLYY